MKKWNPNSKLRKIVSTNIRFYREKSNISKEELSIRLGRKEDFIDRIENCKTKLEPTLITIDLIAKELNIPIEYLVLERKDENEI